MDQFYYTFQKNKIDLKHYIYKIGSYHYNWHKELEMMVLLSGEIEVCMDGEKKVLLPGDVILIGSNMSHATLAHQTDSIAMVLHINPAFFTDYYDKVDYLAFDCCSAGQDKSSEAFRSIRSRLAVMMLGMEQSGPVEKLRFESAFHSLMYALIEHFPPRQLPASAYQSNKNRQDVIDSIIKFIDRNYRRKITLDDLARHSNYNPSYVSQLFKSHLGINFYDYLTRIRLRAATYDLGQTDHTVSAIALTNGFSDVKALNAAFKATFGKTPSDYRSRLTLDLASIDMSFKKDFLPIDHKQVLTILQDYVGQQVAPSDPLAAAHFDQAKAELERIGSLSVQLEQVAEALRQSAAKLGTAFGNSG